MAAALAAVNPLSMTFLSACGSDSMATAATSSATSAISIWLRYGARKGSKARSGLSDSARGLSEEGLSAGGEVVTELESPQVQFPPHAEIAGEAVQRMMKSRGPVVLEGEMAHPGKAVSGQQRAEQPPGISADHRPRQADDRAPGTEVMQHARCGMTMFAEVKRIELRETAEARILGGAAI